MEIKEYKKLGETVLFQRLENGLGVYQVVKKGFSKAYAFFAVKYGSVDMKFILDGEERITPAGVAHFLEHKMFDMEYGSADSAFADNGAMSNAFTGPDMTAYYFSSTEKFYENLRILLEFVSTPWFSEESIKKEQGIIAQEIGMIEDDPGWRSYNDMMRGLYREHPARISVAGTGDTIMEITEKTLYDCHKAFYNPKNMLLCVAGDMDFDRVIEITEETLRDFRGSSVSREDFCESLEPLEAEVRRSMEVSQPMFMLGIKLPCPKEGEEFKTEVLGDLACDVLFGGSSPLYERLYSEGLINGSFDGGCEIYPSAALISVRGESDLAEKVRDEIFAEAERLAKEGIDEAFFTRLKKASVGAKIKSLNSFDGVCNRLVSTRFCGADYFDFPDIYDSIEKGAVERFIAENIRRERSTLSVVEPLNGGQENE